MPAPIKARIGPFSTGLVTGQDPAALTQGMALQALNCALKDGRLRGSWGPGTTAATLQDARRNLFYHPATGYGFRVDATLNDVQTTLVPPPPSLNLGDRGYGDSLDGNQSTLYWRNGATWALNGTANTLAGILPPNTPTVDAVGAGDDVTFQVTRVREIAGVAVLESNPTGYVATKALSTLNMGQGYFADATLTWDYYYYIYRTMSGDPDGALYYVGKVTAMNGGVDVTYTDVAGVGELDGHTLDWGSGGSPSNDAPPYGDHTPPAQLTVMSDRLHGGDASSEGEGAGTAFGANFDAVVWAETGQPEYMPIKNRYQLASTVQAMASIGPQTFAFLEDQVWSFTGAHSDAITANQTASQYGVRRNCGGTVWRTPGGLVHLAREGLAIFDGYNSRLLLDGILDEKELPLDVLYTGAFYDGIYYLSDGTKTYRVDMTSFPNLRVTTVAVGFTAAYVVTVAQADAALTVFGTAPDPGLYVYDGATGTVKPWRELEEGDVGGSTQLTATWLTGLMTLGDTMKQARVHTFRVDGDGPLTVGFYADPAASDGSGTPLFATTVTASSAVRRYRVPQNIRGKLFQVKVTLPAGSVLRNLELEAHTS